MHAAAFRYVAAQAGAWGPFVSVLEIGSRNVNGSIRHLFDGALYEGVDIVAGDGVDYVCDAARGLPPGPYDCVVCCEVFEHAAGWPRIVENAADVMTPDGWLILTMATEPRAPHSAVDGGPVRDGEHYGNIDPVELRAVVEAAGLSVVDLTDVYVGDLHLTAMKAA